MTKLIGLVKPLTAYMALAVIMGIVGHLCASFITIFGGFAVLDLVGVNVPFSLTIIFISLAIFSVLRAALRYAEQACNHFIAFKLLALIRDKVFQALRKLCPAKLESKDKGDLISVITSDIELLEVFYAHTISPVLIWFFFTLIMTAFIASYHIWLGGLALIAYLTIGVIIPLIISKISGDDGMKFRSKSGALSGFVLDSLRGLSETIQYGQGQKRLAEMNKKTDELSADEERMKKIAGRNIAVTNTVILIFDFMMLFLSAYLYQTNAIGFDGILICTATWVAEGKGSDKQKFTAAKDGMITFAYHKLRCAVAVSLEVDTMAISAFEAMLINNIVEAMTKALEQAIISGDGNGKPKGILNETPAEGQKLTSLKPAYADLIAAEAALPQAYENGAVWCMSKNTFMQYYGLTDSNGQPIGRVNYGIAGKPERFLLGRQVVCCDYVPTYSTGVAENTAFAFLFNFKDYVLNTNYAMGVKKYEDNDTDDKVTKGIMLADGKVVDKNSLVTICMGKAM